MAVRKRAIAAIIAFRRRSKTRQRLLCLATLLLTSLFNAMPGRTSPNIHRPIMTFSAMISGISHRFFLRLYRMPYQSFLKLAKTLFETQNELEISSTQLIRLSVTLRWLAGGSYLDISLSHCIPSSTMYAYCDETIDLINNKLQIRFPYSDEVWLRNAAAGFKRDDSSPLTGCCGAIDGLAVKITEPSDGEVPNSSTYYNRKGWFALNMQAMCDPTYRFTFVSCISPGSSHDSTAYAMSSLARLLSQNTNSLSDGFWIGGDDAHLCSSRLIAPWPGRNLSQAKDCFNYWQSSARIFIEQAFGMLVGRWGVFWRPLRCSLKKNAKVTVACCKLHNFIIDNGGGSNIPTPLPTDNHGHTAPPDYEVHLQDACDMDLQRHRRRRDLESSALRVKFTEEIQDLGLRRPC